MLFVVIPGASEGSVSFAIRWQDAARECSYRADRNPMIPSARPCATVGC
jgi:hypothetical protein